MSRVCTIVHITYNEHEQKQAHVRDHDLLHWFRLCIFLRVFVFVFNCVAQNRQSTKRTKYLLKLQIKKMCISALCIIIYYMLQHTCIYTGININIYFSSIL